MTECYGFRDPCGNRRNYKRPAFLQQKRFYRKSAVADSSDEEADNENAEYLEGEQLVQLRYRSSNSISVVDRKILVRILDQSEKDYFSVSTKLKPRDILNLCDLLKTDVRNRKLINIRENTPLYAWLLGEVKNPAKYALLFRDKNGKIIHPREVHLQVLAVFFDSIGSNTKTLSWRSLLQLLEAYLDTHECLKDFSDFPRKPFLLDPEGNYDPIHFPPAPSTSGLRRRLLVGKDEFEEESLAAKLTALELNYSHLKHRWRCDIRSFLKSNRKKLRPALLAEVKAAIASWETEEEEEEPKWSQGPCGFESSFQAESDGESSRSPSDSFLEQSVASSVSPENAADPDLEMDDEDYDLICPDWKTFKLQPGELKEWIENMCASAVAVLDTESFYSVHNQAGRALPYPLSAPNRIYIPKSYSADFLLIYLEKAKANTSLPLHCIVEPIERLFKSHKCLSLFPDFEFPNFLCNFAPAIAFEEMNKTVDLAVLFKQEFTVYCKSFSHSATVQVMNTNWLNLSAEEQYGYICKAAENRTSWEDADFWTKHPELEPLETIKEELGEVLKGNWRQLMRMWNKSPLEVFLEENGAEMNGSKAERKLAKRFFRKLTEKERRKYEAAVEDSLWFPRLVKTKAQCVMEGDQCRRALRKSKEVPGKPSDRLRSFINAPKPPDIFFWDRKAIERYLCFNPSKDLKCFSKRIFGNGIVQKDLLDNAEIVFDEMHRRNAKRKKSTTTKSHQISQETDSDNRIGSQQITQEIDSDIEESDRSIVSSAITVEELPDNDELPIDEPNTKRQRYLEWIAENPVEPGPSVTVYATIKKQMNERNLCAKDKQPRILLAIANIAADVKAQEEALTGRKTEEYEWPDVPVKQEQLEKVLEAKVRDPKFLLRRKFKQILPSTYKFMGPTYTLPNEPIVIKEKFLRRNRNPVMGRNRNPFEEWITSISKATQCRPLSAKDPDKIVMGPPTAPPLKRKRKAKSKEAESENIKNVERVPLDEESVKEKQISDVMTMLGLGL